MNISSITTNYYTSGSSVYDNQIKGLEKQKERLQEQIKRINESDTDEQTKKEYIKSLKNQIEVIETQIQQKLEEKTQQATKQRELKQGKSDSTDEETVYQADLIKADASLYRAAVISDIKIKLNGQGAVLSEEISLDQARGDATEAKQAELQGIEKKKLKLDGELGDSLRSADTKENESSEDETAATRNTHEEETIEKSADYNHDEKKEKQENNDV